MYKVWGLEAIGASNQDKGLTSAAIGHNAVISALCPWAVGGSSSQKGMSEVSQGIYHLSEDGEFIGCLDDFLGDA